MLKYKIGDTVVLNDSVDSDINLVFSGGCSVVITALNYHDDDSNEGHYTVTRGGKVWWINDSEIEHDISPVVNKTIDMRVDSWFIKIESKEQFDAVQHWLVQRLGYCLKSTYTVGMGGVTNTMTDGQVVRNHVMYYTTERPPSEPCQEIKLTFDRPAVGSVDFPSKPSEAIAKLESIAEQIVKLKKDAAFIKENLLK